MRLQRPSCIAAAYREKLAGLRYAARGGAISRAPLIIVAPGASYAHHASPWP